MIEAQCLQVEWCLEQTNHYSNAADVYWRDTFFTSIHSLQGLNLEKHILKLLNSTCLSIWNTYREFSVSDSDRRYKFHWYQEHGICFNALKSIWSFCNRLGQYGDSGLQRLDLFN